MNIKNSKKVKIRSRLQTITDTFPDYNYDMESTNDEWIVHFTHDTIDSVKFMLEISSIDDNINNFKYFYDNEWNIYSETNFQTIIEISENKITELYG